MTTSALRRPGSARTRQAVKVLVVGRFAFIDQEFKDLLQPVLTAMHQEFMPTGEAGIQVEQHEVPLWRDNGDLVVFPAGAVSRVVRTLEDAGHDVLIQHKSPHAREPAQEMLCDHRAGPEERAFLHRLQGHWLGQVVYRTARELASNIGRIACFFPDRKIFVVTSGRRSARQLAKQIRRFVDHGEVHTDIQQAWLVQADCT